MKEQYRSFLALRFASAVLFPLIAGGPIHAQTATLLQPTITIARPDEDSIPRHAGALQVVPMSFRDQSAYYVRHSFDPGSLLIPALPAAIIMASPPKHYPHDWRAGAPAFGRNFGDGLATEEAAKTGKFLAAALFHEDPRYFPDTRTQPWHRAFHALAFTVVDSSTHGRPRFAVSNFAGAAAGGFVGKAYLPPGYSDNIHAGQRAGGTLVGYIPVLIVGFATQNLFEEFSPELKALGQKLHVPFIH